MKVAAILDSNPVNSLAKPVEPAVTGEKVRAMDDDELAAFWNGDPRRPADVGPRYLCKNPEADFADGLPHFGDRGNPAGREFATES